MGYLSLIFLEAKFGAPTRISEANFGAKLPVLLIWKHPLGCNIYIYQKKVVYMFQSVAGSCDDFIEETGADTRE